MGAFDYGGEAALFSAKGTHSRSKSVEYRLFVRAAEAVRLAIVYLP
jgi:hypothetical protein